MIQYILECIAFQIVFLIIYDLFLKRETFFQWNRAYLIGTYVLSMVLPWVKIEAPRTKVPEVFQATLSIGGIIMMWQYWQWVLKKQHLSFLGTMGSFLE